MRMKKTSLARKLKRGDSLKPLADSMPLLENWFQGVAGARLLQQEQTLMQDVLATLFGYHLMQLSTCRDVCLYQYSKIRHRFAAGPVAGGNIGTVCDEQLPLEAESIDVAILHHVMEYSQQPHLLLREVSRVVVPSGYVVIVGFNPLGAMGVLSLKDRIRRRGLWQNQLFGIRRLADWLTFMDFTVQSVQYGYYRLPSDGVLGGQFAALEKLLQRWQLPLGGFYVLLAKKEVSRLTPVRFRRRLGKSRIPVMEPSFYTERPNKKTTLH